jgi:hypothetical protein
LKNIWPVNNLQLFKIHIPRFYYFINIFIEEWKNYYIFFKIFLFKLCYFLNMKFAYPLLFFILLYSFEYSTAGTENCPYQCACGLNHVVCTGQALTSIPLGIPFGTIRLDLQQNQISHLYKNDFKNLTSLKYLDLSNNALEKN